MGGERRREKSLRIGVHHANAVVWEPVYRTHLRRDETRRDDPGPPPPFASFVAPTPRPRRAPTPLRSPRRRDRGPRAPLPPAPPAPRRVAPAPNIAGGLLQYYFDPSDLSARAVPPPNPSRCPGARTRCTSSSRAGSSPACSRTSSCTSRTSSSSRSWTRVGPRPSSRRPRLGNCHVDEDASKAKLTEKKSKSTERFSSRAGVSKVTTNGLRPPPPPLVQRARRRDVGGFPRAARLAARARAVARGFDARTRNGSRRAASDEIVVAHARFRYLSSLLSARLSSTPTSMPSRMGPPPQPPPSSRGVVVRTRDGVLLLRRPGRRRRRP